MKKRNLSWVAALLVFALLMWVTSATPGTIADPETYECAVYSTALSLLPPVIAIVLALMTKEVYTSLLLGIASGALLYANGNLELAINTLFFHEDGGMVYKLADSWNVGILVFLVMLGILVALMNKAGGSAAFGKWASTHIHSRAGAQIATMLLGVMIFVDDYFNCLTVGSVMRPVTDRQKISRAKLAYLIDATAAPVCIIAPVSSWAAAVTSSVPEGSGINGFTMFLRTIPYNYYAILTLIMMVFLIVTGLEYGSMQQHEQNAALRGDLFTTEERPYGDDSDVSAEGKGGVADLVVPVLVLIAACIFGMVYTGGFFDGVDFITAFADCDASMGLVLGSSIALVFTFVFYRVREVMSFQDFASCIPEGFKAMVSPILILTLAWTLSGMTGLLGAKYFVASLLSGSAAAVQYLLPVIIFVVAVFLAFATGTSWGTFSILVPIVCHAFPQGEMLVISIAACLSGAVCGDHCSPISDTTIMASAGAHCSHVNHVSTQLPYAITAAAISAVCYLITGLSQAVLGQSAGVFTSAVLLIVAVVVELVVLSVMRARMGRKEKAAV
ncbi:MAG: Na+/H+ antiporter NhaC family protein [Faecalibacterium sp.]